MKEESDIETQQRIYSLILNNPGLHSRKIAMILKISGQLADYHLQYMERKNMILSSKEAGYRRYYVEGKLGVEDRKKLALLRQEIPLKIVLFLIKKPGSRHKEILSMIKISPSTLSYHIKKLVETDLVTIVERGELKKFYVKDVSKIKDLLVKYKPHSWVDNFSDMWSDFTW